jgi:hypothetical protein
MQVLTLFVSASPLQSRRVTPVQQRAIVPARVRFLTAEQEQAVNHVVNRLFTAAKVPLAGFTPSVRAFIPY